MTTAPILTLPCTLRDSSQCSRRNAPPPGVLAIALLALVCGSSALADAQVTAHQGEGAFDPAKRFTSPMVLTIPLPELTADKDVRDLSVGGIRNYRCEDASIAAMTISVSTARKGKRTYEFAGMLLVDESFDRLVSLNLGLHDGAGNVLVTGRQLNISVEERKSARFLIRTEVSAEQADLIDRSGLISLRLTMHVRKD